MNTGRTMILSATFSTDSSWSAAVGMETGASGRIGEKRLKVWRDNNGTKRFF